MADIQRGKGSILVSYLCPEGISTTEQIDLQYKKHLNVV